MSSGRLERPVDPTPINEAEEWIATYDDLDIYIADCGDDDDLHVLARAMEDDALASGYDGVDVGTIMETLIDRRRAIMKGLGIEEAALER